MIKFLLYIAIVSLVTFQNLKVNYLKGMVLKGPKIYVFGLIKETFK